MILFIISSALLFFTTHLDLKSTFIALKNPRVHEANGLVRWAIKRGKFVSYLFTSAFNAGICALCFWVQQITHVNLAWCALPLAIGSLGHFWAYKHNQKNYLSL